LDRVADGKILAARWVIDFDNGSGLPQRRLLSDFLHGQNRTTGNVAFVEDVHRLELVLGLGPFLDLAEDLHEVRQARLRCRVTGVGQPILASDHLADFSPDRRLCDEIDVGIGVGLPALALQDPSRLAATRCVSGARHRIAELSVGILWVLVHHAGAREALLVAQLDPAQVQDAILHGGEHALPAPGGLALVERGDDPERQMQARPRVADLRPGHQRRAIVEAGRRCRASGALRDVLVHLAILVRSGPETLDRGHNHARIERLDMLPGQTHPVERAGREIFYQDIATLHQRFQYFLAFRVLGIDRNRPLVVIEHREIQAVDAGYVAQLTTRDVALARAFDFYDVG